MLSLCVSCCTSNKKCKAKGRGSNPPKASNEPLQGLATGSDEDTGSKEAQALVNVLIQLLVLFLGQQSAICELGGVAKQGGFELQQGGRDLTQGGEAVLT